MAIISFWNQNNISIGKTLSMIAIATNLSLQYTYKTLLLDTDFNSHTIEDCFWIEKKQTLFRQSKDKIDLGTGITQLSRAILSNKVSPEVITYYTKIVFTNRLEVLTDTKTKMEDYEKNKTIFMQIAKLANKYYDLVFIDIGKNLDKETTRNLLEISNLVIVPITQNYREISNFLSFKINNETNNQYSLMPILSKYDENSKFTYKKVTKFLKEKQKIPVIPYNIIFADESSSGGVQDFFINNRKIKEKNKNSNFFYNVKDVSDNIIGKIQELQTKM